MPNHLESNVKNNALNIVFSKILLTFLIVLPLFLFYSYFSSDNFQSIIFNFSLGLQAIISACMGFAYMVSIVLAKQQLQFYKKEKENPIRDTALFLLETYRSILPVSIKGKEKLCYTISFLSYLSSAFVLSFEITIMAFSFLLIALSQLQLLLTFYAIKYFDKKQFEKSYKNIEKTI